MKPFNNVFGINYGYKFLQVLLVAFVTVFALNSCGISPEGDDSEQAQNKKNSDKLRNDYASVIGVYRGVLSIKPPIVPGGDPNQSSNDTRDLTGQLSVYIVNVSSGVDRTGAPISYPQVVAQLKFDGVGELDDTTFLVKYDKFAGGVELNQVAPTAGSTTGSAGTVTACPVGPKDPRLSIDGKIVGGQFVGNVNGTSGYLGKTVMTKTSNEDAQPIRDQRERLIRAFAPILGTWSGSSKIKNSAGNAVNTTTNIYLYTEEIDAGQGVTCPTLRSQFRLPEVVGRLEDTYLAVSYREGTGELFLTYMAPPASLRVCSVGPVDNKLTFTGAFNENGTLAGVLQGSPGRMGDVAVKQVSKVASAPDDQRDRLAAAYGQIQGTYAGQFISNGSKYDNFPVWIDLSVVDTPVSEYLTCPGLKGQYRRPDLVSNAGSLVLSAQFLPSSQHAGRLTIQSVGSDGATGIPGHTYLKATADWSGNGGSTASFSGPMQWWQSVGTVKVVKCPRGNVSRLGQCK